MTDKITYSNIHRYDNLPWQDYVSLPGYSFSWLKNEKKGGGIFVPTPKMKLGTLVDKLLTGQNEITGEDLMSEDFNHAKQIAIQIKNKFGFALNNLAPQVSFTGIAEFKGLKMPVKGRLDWLLNKHSVNDLKVTDSTDLQNLITFMQYDEQMFNYCNLAQVDTAYIIAYSKKLRKCLDPFPIKKPETSKFWESMILKYGIV